MFLLHTDNSSHFCVFFLTAEGLMHIHQATTWGKMSTTSQSANGPRKERTCPVSDSHEGGEMPRWRQGVRGQNGQAVWRPPIGNGKSDNTLVTTKVCRTTWQHITRTLKQWMSPVTWFATSEVHLMESEYYSSAQKCQLHLQIWRQKCRVGKKRLKNVWVCLVLALSLHT